MFLLSVAAVGILHMGNHTGRFVHLYRSCVYSVEGVVFFFSVCFCKDVGYVMREDNLSSNSEFLGGKGGRQDRKIP